MASKMYDVMENITTHYDVLDKGFVRLVDCMPRLVPEGQTADSAVVQMARVSYGDGTKTVNDDNGLIRYLMRHRHTTPFEGVEFKFHCKMPIFVARQWIRHRTANVNEISGRYSQLKDEFYLPTADDVRAQSKTNKQGSEGKVDDEVSCGFSEYVENICSELYKTYEEAINGGVAKEQARMILPTNIYTEWYWKIDLHNLLHFLSLRCDPHAQQEIRDYGNAMLRLVKDVVPMTICAWEDYHPLRCGVLLTKDEVDAINEYVQELRHEISELSCHSGYEGIDKIEDRVYKIPAINSENKRENAEWFDKATKLGF